MTSLVIGCEIDWKILISPIDRNGNEPQKSAMLMTYETRAWSVYLILAQSFSIDDESNVEE